MGDQLENDAGANTTALDSYGHNFINALSGTSLVQSQRKRTHVLPDEIGFLVCSGMDPQLCTFPYGDYRPKQPHCAHRRC